MSNKRYSLHFGVNTRKNQDPNAADILCCADNDAKAMYDLVCKVGFECAKAPFIDQEATIAAFYENICEIQSKILPGDLLVLTFSGHGGRKIDENNDEILSEHERNGKEIDPYDETWIFYDGELVDDDINRVLKKFAAGVKILIISDSCFGGEIYRGEEIEMIPVATKSSEIDAALILLASCRENQYSQEEWTHGLFTNFLLKTWKDGKFTGNYSDFYNQMIGKIKESVLKCQTPIFYKNPAAEISFWKEKPFLNE